MATPFSIQAKRINREAFRLSAKGSHYWLRKLKDGAEVTYLISVEEFDKEDGLVMGTMIIAPVVELDSL